MKLKIIEHENRSIMMMIEIERLGNIIMELQDELQQHADKETTYRKESEELHEKLVSSQTQIDDVKASVESEKLQQQEQIKGLKSKLEQENRQLKVENQSLKNQLEMKDKEVEDWRNKMYTSDKQHVQMTEELKRQFEDSLRERVEAAVREASSQYESEIADLDSSAKLGTSRANALE